MNSAEIRLKVSNPDSVYKALEPEIQDTKRFEVKVFPEGDTLRINVEAKDATALKAAINSYLRLIEVITSVKEVK